MMEKMTPEFAVFNGHINDAAKKTRKFMNKWFPQLLSKVDQISENRGGIMGIFHEPSSEATSMYVALVTYIVNEGRS